MPARHKPYEARWLCIASGPSLTREDCDKARAWQAAKGGTVAVTNTTFTICEWADHLVALDSTWWRKYHADVNRTFSGQKWSRFGILDTQKLPEPTSKNSGAAAILLAASLGASEIYLLGYDCQVSDKTHWHGDHPQGLGNCASLPHWPAHFAQVANMVPVPIINCSRQSALTVFKKGVFDEHIVS